MLSPEDRSRVAKRDAIASREHRGRAGHATVNVFFDLTLHDDAARHDLALLERDSRVLVNASNRELDLREIGLDEVGEQAIAILAAQLGVVLEHELERPLDSVGRHREGQRSHVAAGHLVNGGPELQTRRNLEALPHDVTRLDSG